MIYLRISTLICFIALLSACNPKSGTTAEVAVDGTPQIAFSVLEHHLGDLTEGEKAGCFFNFTNEGTSPLIIYSASTSCGCTVPKFNKKPMLPGESGSLEVIFDTSGREGFQSKTITVQSNSEIPVIVLKITANVGARKN